MSLESPHSAEVPAPDPSARKSPSAEVVAAQLETARRVAALGDREQEEARRAIQAGAEGSDVPTVPAAAVPVPAKAPATAPAADGELGFLDQEDRPVAAVAKAPEAPRPSAAKEALIANQNVIAEQGGERLDRKSADAAAMEAIGPVKAAAVRAQAKRLMASPSGLYVGVPEDAVVMAVLVAGAPDLRAGLSADVAAKFDKAVNSIEAAGDAKFRELVAKLRSPDDQRAVTEAYEKAKADAKREGKPFAPVITDDAKHLILADPLRPDAPGERFDVRRGGGLARKEGKISVLPPSDVKQAECLKLVSGLVRQFPFSAVPEGFWRMVIGMVNTPALRSKFGTPGQAHGGFDFSGGLSASNRAVLCQAGEKVLGVRLFADADYGNGAPSPSVDANALPRRWADFRNRASATSYAVELRRALMGETAAHAKGPAAKGT